MSEHVLVLALGATRRRAAIDDAERVVARGGTADLVVRAATAWRDVLPAGGVRLIDVAELEQRRAWVPVERLLLYRVPLGLLRVLGFGSLKPWSEQARRAYQRRIADPLHRRLHAALIRPGDGRLTAGLIRRQLGRDSSIDLLLVNDPASMPTAVALLREHGPGAQPPVSYDLDHAGSGAEGK
jgi:hypothetical protein